MKSPVISLGVLNVEILLEAVVSSPSPHRLNQHNIATCFQAAQYKHFPNVEFSTFIVLGYKKELSTI